MLFVTVVILTIFQRFYELGVARKNTRTLLAQGAVEFGASHYPIIVGMHALFFLCMLGEAFVRGLHPPDGLWPVLFLIFMAAQVARVWIIQTLNGRWTTRILVLPGKPLISTGPFRFIPHPNYGVVAIEILVLPLIFGLTYTALVFTVLNAVVLLTIRIPEERRALDWAASGKPRSAGPEARP